MKKTRLIKKQFLIIFIVNIFITAFPYINDVSESSSKDMYTFDDTVLKDIKMKRSKGFFFQIARRV